MEVNSFPHSITFNGKNSLEFSLYVSGDKTFNSPEKDYTKVSVPGRSGDLVISNNRYKNINVVYSGIIINDYSNNVEKIRDWLLSPDGYCRLEDTYHPDEFRLACFSGPIDFDTLLLEAGSTSLSFDCKPQRFLKSAENVYDYTYITDSTDTQKIYKPLTGDSAPLYISNHYYRKEIVERYYDVDEEQLYYYDEKFILLTSQTQPTDWVYNYKSYYVLNEDIIIVNPTSQISKPLIQIDINSLKFKQNTYYKQLESFDILMEKPSDWYWNFTNYYILSGNEYKNISKDSLYNYTVSVGTGIITLKDVKINETYYIDCENLECYDGNFLCKNEKLIITKWPTFLSGNNTIKELETNDVCCTIKINPRWWRL